MWGLNWRGGVDAHFSQPPTEKTLEIKEVYSDLSNKPHTF
ncbi:hypothetical protein COLSTE_02312 [Collinsella stercoris DSM 13279]|uniref:Uncharacterized protein n=1 Tax=Collinsella stercoris DSM 13279 TaxID=445975 RepID=B6GDW6_9ACTN|nr:hypothetical protein COLSTE_02312 [Collinsella stercoris DSM 13279]